MRKLLELLVILTMNCWCRFVGLSHLSLQRRCACVGHYFSIQAQTTGMLLIPDFQRLPSIGLTPCLSSKRP